MGGSLRPPPGLAGYRLVNDLNALYREAIKRHAANPTGYRQEINATHQFEEYNPLCGDRILMQMRISQEQVKAAAFNGEACAICMASASLLCEHTPGKSVGHLQDLHDRLLTALNSDQRIDGIDPLRPLFGVKSYPSRIRCATLPWTAASKAL
jgi:nitrogen fixation NifU-like protein